MTADEYIRQQIGELPLFRPWFFPFGRTTDIDAHVDEVTSAHAAATEALSEHRPLRITVEVE
jgi:hypothetical protein